ncbi:hypothetical protein CSC70_12490 [Pseudoxanthomonas kalamensis DSM 18571]|nr:hypothetical protein CSC70_12490 [Pseudoxanthomonas kalamensis DSM 18571]
MEERRRVFANLPDRGQLLSFGDGVRQQGAYKLYPVKVSEEHAFRAVATGRMSIPKPDGSALELQYERHEESPDGNWSWIGRVIDGDQAQEAIITFGENAVFGSIPQGNGPALRLVTQDGLAYVAQPDATKLKSARLAATDIAMPGGLDIDAAAYSLVEQAEGKVNASSSEDVQGQQASASLARQDMASSSSRVSSAADSSSAVTIDLVAGYSNGIVSRVGSQSAAVTLLNNLVSISNQALSNSNVDARIRLVHSVAVAYADNTSNSVALEELTGSDGASPISVPTSLQALREAREEYGADLVTLVRQLKQEQEGCGIAWLLGADQEEIVPAIDASFGYSVVSDGEYTSGGSTYYCDDISLIHEMAHNMGSAHDESNALDDGGELVYGRYPYSFGYKTSPAGGNFYTVMAYGDNNQTLYRYFSNPDVSACGGVACGISDHADNARSLRQTVSIIASFRATKVDEGGDAGDDGEWLAYAGDLDADGDEDLLFNNAGLNEVNFWKLQGLAVAGTGSAKETNEDDALGAVGDFNGDGKLDTVWSTPEGDLWMWLGNGSDLAASSIKLAVGLGAGWKMAGAGDINGDGKDDLLFTNPVAYRYTYWIMNGATIISRRASVPAGKNGDTLVAHGDFNGDGNLDLLWQTPKRELWMWMGNGSHPYASYKKIATLGAGWGIEHAGDVDGDGKDDLVFINPSPNRYTYWIMDGPNVSRQSAVIRLNAGDELMAGGDFSGDDKLDLLWKTTKGDMWVWLGNGNALSSSYRKIGNVSSL